MIIRDGEIIKLNSKIINYDPNNILIPNNQNINFKIIAAIVHHGDTANSGHYVIWTRYQNSWLRISDTEARSYNNLIQYLNNVYLLILKKL